MTGKFVRQKHIGGSTFHCSHFGLKRVLSLTRRMNVGTDERLISGHWGLDMATLIDPLTQSQASATADMTSMAGMVEPRRRQDAGGERMTFQQAWATIRPRLDTPITLADLEDMPAAKRRCLEEKVVDAAM